MTSLHIIKNKGWKVLRRPQLTTSRAWETKTRALKVEKYRELAFLYACQHAKENETIYVHKSDGTIEFSFEVTDN